MKGNADDDSKYSADSDSAFKRTARHLQILLKRTEQRPFDLGYEALRGAAYKAGGGLVTMVIAWIATRR